ncbi:transporter [Clostridium estertheticum]|uniref:Transporter n=1 Tax=Clostridium estertheticum TaxID=238834 RepID=A0AA47EGM0_9CLOT|nr:transporter [Clostridium estertheticum]MBU3156254.1 transporter [Clostridium estertheticum]MBU3200757.1 transporter [Clostridium estertheticum]WAG59848.1 transporter [Clostridium estertheticum]WAG66081.1 transporter [Clostridium estertheticum]
MKKTIGLIFQTAAVFIGTIVGAGLASGQEITQFFSTYGYVSFWGILVCCLIYIIVSSIIVSISLKHKLSSYTELITLVSPGFFGIITDVFTSFFLVSGAAVILAGSGALLHQYFGISKWVGILLMAIISLYTVLKDTKGLITINSFIVPTLITIIVTIFVLYLLFYKDMVSVTYIKQIASYKNNIIPAQWFFSALLYAGFNMLCCSGVLVPLSQEIKHKRVLIPGVIVGALGLTILCYLINTMLLLNIPQIFKYEIPLLYITHRFGMLMQILLLCVIFCEMFSTEVSNIYSVGKTLEKKFDISYKKAVLLILVVALPISQIGFKTLIKVLYPGFGAISFIFLIQCILFYKKTTKRQN